MTLLLKATTGQEIYQNASAKAYAFLMPSNAFRGNGKELNMTLACKAGIGVTLLQTEGFLPPFPNAVKDAGGWVTNVYQLPEGAVVKIFGTRSGTFGQSKITGNLIAVMREGAAYRRVSVILTGSQRSTISRANIEGRFDIVSPVEAVSLGVMIPGQFASAYEPHYTRRAFEITEIEPERTQRPAVEIRQVVASSGEQVPVAVRQRTRRALII